MAVIILTIPAVVKRKTRRKMVREAVVKARRGLFSVRLNFLKPRLIFLKNRKRKLRPPRRPVVVRRVKNREPDSLKRVFQRLELAFRKAGLSLVKVER